MNFPYGEPPEDNLRSLAKRSEWNLESTETYCLTGAKGFPPRERRTICADGAREREVSVAGMKVYAGKCVERREVNSLVREEPRNG